MSGFLGALGAHIALFICSSNSVLLARYAEELFSGDVGTQSTVYVFQYVGNGEEFALRDENPDRPVKREGEIIAKLGSGRFKKFFDFVRIRSRPFSEFLENP